MKKVYIKPSTLEVIITTKTQMLQASQFNMEVKPEEGTETMDSRRKNFSIWGDDDED